MQTIKIRQTQEHVAVERLQTAACIPGTVTEHRSPHGIGNSRLKLLESACLAADTLTSDQPDLRPSHFQCANELRDECGVVLPIAVERHHNGRARRRDSGAHRCRLAAGLLMPNAAQPGVLHHQPFQFCVGVIT